MSRFETTRWSLVLQARDAAPAARHALDNLCRVYRPAVIAFVRGRGHAPDDAEDLAQAFFARFLEQAWHADADPARGRFRTFLLVTLKRFLADDAVRAHALKRGSDVRIESLDADDAVVPAGEDSPELAFQRAWAVALLHAAIGRLHAEAEQAGKGALFATLREFLIEPPDEADYARAAAALGMRRNTLAVAVHRLRQRLRILVESEVEQTTANSGDYAEEMSELHAALGSAGAVAR